MFDHILFYKASQSPGSIYDFMFKQNVQDDETNFQLANEYADFKEFLIDVYMDGGHEEFKECYLQFMRWQGYDDEEIEKLWPGLLSIEQEDE